MTVVLIVARRRARRGARGARRPCCRRARPRAPAPPTAVARRRAGSCSRSSADALSRARSTPRCGWRAEDATLVPVFLARVPLAPPARRAAAAPVAIAIPLQEAIEQRATEFGVPVDARIERGPHLPPRAAADDRAGALRPDRDRRRRRTAAPGSTPTTSPGCSTTPPGEIVVLRPSADDPARRRAPALAARRLESRRTSGRS